jgi:tetratricopeptide (TPR) repeat protein
MRAVPISLSVAAVLLLASANTDVSARQAQQDKPPSPADRAFRDALNTKEAAARLAAFRTLVAQFPDSDVVKNGAPQFNIFSLATNLVAAEAQEARDAAEAYAARLPPANRGKTAWANTLLAMAFARTDVMWPEAERYARKALESWDSGAAAGPPRDAGQALERAIPLWLLGQALAAQRRDDEAERYLREAYQDRPNAPGIVGQVMPVLLDIAKRRGRADDQVECLVALALYGGLTPARRLDLDKAYRRTHHGSLDGLEAMLDARYEAELPARIPVASFARAPRAEARTVLAEMFTGASCGPCVGLDLALEAALRRYRLRDLAVLVYHQHAPSPDPLVSPSAEARAKWYGFVGVPYLFVDGGKLDDEGGGKVADATGLYRNKVQPAIDRALANPPQARLTLDAVRAGTIITARVVVHANSAAGRTPALRLHVALAEDRVRYSGGNGIRFHPMVVRKMARDGAGSLVPATGTARMEVTFDLAAIGAELKSYLDDYEKSTKAASGPFAFNEKKCDLDSSNLVVVAFVQEDGSRRVLQSVVARPPK